MFSTKSKDDYSVVIAKEEGITLPASATGYSSVLPDFVSPDKDHENKFISVFAKASAVAGTNVDIGLYGEFEAGGDKVLLLDLGDLTNAARTNAFTIDLNKYKALGYYLGHTVDADNSANDVSYYVGY